MRAFEVPVGSRVVDSFPFSLGGTKAEAEALAASGVDGVALYCGVTSAETIAHALDAGLFVIPVTKAGAYTNGAFDEIAWLQRIGVPAGVTVFLDLEGLAAYHTAIPVLTGEVNAWAGPVNAGGWIASLYVGSPQPFTSKELYALAVKRYWLGIGRCVDRFNVLAEPECGWCMIQQWHGNPSGMIWRDTGVLVDTNGVGKDHKGRLPIGFAL